MNQVRKKVFVAGHSGMVGSAAIVCESSKHHNVLLLLVSRSELDLTDSATVDTYMQFHNPDHTVKC